MPDILLIQPPIRDFYLTAKRTIPYGLTCIASALMQNGFSVAILDGLATSKARIRELPEEMNYLHPYYGRPDLSPFALFHHFRHYGNSFDTIGQRAGESGAFLVGISSLFTPYVGEALRTAHVVKACLPEAKIVLGGHHPSAMPESVMASAAVDFVIRGEGEVAMPLLARALSDGSRYAGIAGLVSRNNDGTIRVNPVARMQNLDDYPLPATPLIKQKFYRRQSGASMVVVASRGCPMKCSYCSVGAPSALRYRQRSVAAVIEEIENFASQHNLGFIDFEDENLSLDRRWFLRLLQEITSRFDQGRPELRAMNGLYPPSLDEEVIAAMQAAGFKTLNLSLGSTTAEQLSRFKRADVRPAFERALNSAERYGMQAVGYVICSAPFQRAEDSISDLLYLAGRRVLVGMSVFYPAPGSRDYELCEMHGLLPDHLTGMRSSALPLSHTTSRKQAATLLRLTRILNFMKSLLDTGTSIPAASPAKIRIANLDNRIEIGRQLIGKFLDDGRIRGVTPQGEVYDHLISGGISREFVAGLSRIKIRGTI
jgi:anaerobic magnesium-protoporphyrin IX monomethyl ester cyclase